MEYFSVCSGVGGFDLALDRQGHTCVGYSEIDKYAIQIYKKNFGEEITNYGNATDIDAEQLPDFDILCGGFPCQTFSIAGKRKGFEDTRGTLFFEIVRIARCKRPRYLFLENVRGLLSHNKGHTFRIILETLWELGYTYQWGVVNSRYHGVPQNRERVFIIAHLRGEPRPEVFPLRAKTSKDIGQIASTALDANYWKGIDNHGQKTAIVYDDYNSRLRVDDVAGTVTQTCSRSAVRNGQKVIAMSVMTPDIANKKQNGRQIKSQGEPSFTLTARDRHGVYDGAQVRRLTPVECERLQGFPDRWTAQGIDEDGNVVGISDTQRYKTMGNAVTVNVVEAIVKRLE